MCEFFIRNDLISQNQPTFKPGNSCINQLLAITYDICKSSDGCLDVRAVLLDILSSQQTFQRWFNFVFRLIWRCDVAQRQINVDTTLCTSTLKFTTFNNVELTLYISTSKWTTFTTSKQRCCFQRRFLQL